MDDQNQAPILDIICHYLAERPTAFYFPGHRGRSLDDQLTELWGRSIWQTDLPELPGIEAGIGSAEKLAAQSVGADQTWFLTNGATIGIHAMFLCFPGAKVLVGRNCHRATIGGMVLADTTPVYLPTEFDPVTGVDLGVRSSTLELALNQHPDAKAVFLVSPNYYGVVGEIKHWVRLCHDRSIPLLIDSAHGSHLGFHPGFPASAVSLGADLVVQSCHKTGASFTQTAMLHLKSTLIERETIDRSLSILRSTSPSLLLLASLDSSRRVMATQGHLLLERLLSLSKRLQSSLSWLISYDDPSRIIAIPPSGTGFELDQWLCSLHPPVIAELPTFDHLVFALTIGTEAKDIDRLINTLKAYPMQQTKKEIPKLDPLSITKPICTPRQAYYAQGETVKPQEAIDRVSRGVVCPYPPGIPLLLPGERITKETIDYLTAINKAGGILQGWSAGIDVVKLSSISESTD